VQAEDGGFDCLIRVEGFEASVQYRASELTQRFAKFGAVDVVVDPWAEVKDLVLGGFGHCVAYFSASYRQFECP
jgi:hypothetical protein